jgi:transcriptional regulator
MYVPSHYVESDPRWIEEFVREVSAGTIITNGATQLHANFVPLLFDGKRKLLRGHISRANEQWRDLADNRQALATFTGGSAYISPNWYPTKADTHRVVPTWNYEIVQMYGAISFSHDAATLIEIISALTDREERASARPWRVTDAPQEYLDGMVKSIVAFEIEISRIEAKRKLSQNKTEADRWGAIAGLRERGDFQSNRVADAMESLGQ